MAGFPREQQKIKIRIFSMSELKAIHWTTLDVLERTGVKICARTTLSFEQLVIDDEIVNMTFRLAKGIEVKDETIVLHLIQKLVPEVISWLKGIHLNIYAKNILFQN